MRSRWIFCPRAVSVFGEREEPRLPQGLSLLQGMKPNILFYDSMGFDMMSDVKYKLDYFKLVRTCNLTITISRT